MKYWTTSVKLPESYRERLKKKQIELDRSMGWIIRTALDDYLKEKPAKAKKAPATKEVHEIPDYIDGELWMDFVEMRKQIKKPITDIAIKRILKDFDQWHQEGVDCNQAIRESIRGQWQGIFKPKQNDMFGAKKAIEDFINGR